MIMAGNLESNRSCRQDSNVFLKGKQLEEEIDEIRAFKKKKKTDEQKKLGGGNSNIFLFSTPKNWGNDNIFEMGGSTTN